jgi:mannitol/fructose-specific phosphotransferase system IIA component (Ntr-type)
MGIASVEIAFFFLALTLGVYFFYGRKKYSGQFAIGLILERIIDKKVANRHLEKELREIVLNRDEIELDRFDDLVLNSTVFDFDKTLNLDEVFKICISELHKEYSVNTESVKKEFFSRKGIEHTAINEFLAIPHIVVNEDILKLFIVRNKSGIRFSEKADSIKCMFILIGTKNDKKFHLQTLAAIAKISLEKGFEENWLRIKSESIKEFIILSERKRF